MQDADFGFTRRDATVLQKALTVENSNEKQSDGKKCVQPAGKGDPMAGRREGDVASGPGRTGNEGGPGSGQCSLSPSVAAGPPNIPNVVEYHLKVKPGTVYSLEDAPKNHRVEEMKKEKVPVAPTEKRKDVTSKSSRLSIEKNVLDGFTELPQVFQVKYLGSHDARGLWGIKHTRRPVDNMVASAKALPGNAILPLIKLIVSEDGVALVPLDQKRRQEPNGRLYRIETISYGVQDLVYTRVFSMIIVRESENFRRVSPFECHAFVCESKHHARRLTYALATAFDLYSRSIKARDKLLQANTRSRFAIDLRSPEEIEADLCVDSEA